MQKPDAVLIDNDQLVHMCWQLVADEKSKNLKSYTSAVEFFGEAAEFDKSTPIFVDVELGNGIRGEVIANEIAERGFTDISLTTGFDASSIVKPLCVRQIVDKNPCF